MTDATQAGAAKKSRVSVMVSKDSMSATIVLRKPSPGDRPITIDEVMEEIARNEVVYGVDSEAIRKAVDEGNYNNPVKIADGTPPRRGVNAQFTYHFDTSQQLKPQESEDGRIDYKNINFIQNIEKEGVLVTKIPPKPGEPGTNVRGKPIKGPDGRDIPFKGGTNTKVSEDGLTLTATTSGAIVYLYGKVSVNDVMVIKGDVDFSVGNLDCRGSVRVSGGVKAGFELKIDGDLEVAGNVEDCNIDVKGNIMVKGGFFGKGSGIMRAGGEVYLKYAEGQRIEAGGDVFVGGEVINCQIVSRGNVRIKGRRGKIVGGDVKAHKEIRAAVLGSEAGTATVLAVAHDSAIINRYHEIGKETNRLKEDSARVKGVLVGLYKLQLDGKLVDEQKQALTKLERFQKELPETLAGLEKEKAEIEEALRKLEGARIVAEDTIYPGVKAYFGLVYREIQEESQRCVLKLEGNRVLFSELREDH